MKHRIFSLLVFTFFLFGMSACSSEEPFDVGAGQKQMTGKWQYVVPENSEEEPYQMTISPNGVMGLSIANFVNLDVTIRADLPSEDLLIIPTQTKDEYSIGATAVISDFREMTITYHYTDGNGNKTDAVGAYIKVNK